MKIDTLSLIIIVEIILQITYYTCPRRIAISGSEKALSLYNKSGTEVVRFASARSERKAFSDWLKPNRRQ